MDLVQNTSVSLAQLPYTGFDYGTLYNTLFWPVLFVWSLLIARFILAHMGAISKGIAATARVFMVEQRQVPEPQILHEVVRAPVVSSALQYEEVLKDTLSTISESTAKIQKSLVAPVLTKIEDIQKYVKEELKKSRRDQHPDEFTEEDFAIVDFDGINPDDSWVARPQEQAPQRSVEQSARLAELKREIAESRKALQIKTGGNAVLNSGVTSKSYEEAYAAPKESGVRYTDSIMLDRESEYPKIVLNRAGQPQ